ncbi:hypothetical protein V1512DRAFT_231685 [Lipomyces arxii]|uniref:uncharacterized protein n=1 Tax=Lipomyces arxii TaxID=56418 RepID=UPI0034CE19AF
MPPKRSLKSTSWTEPTPTVPVAGYGGFALGVMPPVNSSQRDRRARPVSATKSRSATSTPDQTPDQTRSPAEVIVETPPSRSGGSKGVGKNGGQESPRKTLELEGESVTVDSGSSSTKRKTRTAPKPKFAIILPPPEDSDATELADEDETMSESSRSKILKSTSQTSLNDYGRSKSDSDLMDLGRETKVRLKFKKKFDDYVVKSSVIRPSAKVDEKSPAVNGKTQSKLSTTVSAADTKENSKETSKNLKDNGVDSEKTKKRQSMMTPPPESNSLKRNRQKRIKISPVKSRPTREHPFGFGAPDLAGTARAVVAPPADQDDPTRFNDDFCSACGGIGRFLCCEGCPRSFHFTCVDPPYDEDNLPDGAWYCKSCYVKRHPLPLPQRGLFSELLDQLARQNPVCFSLPKSLRERYEGVTTSDFGEYQDAQDLKPKRMSRNGFIEETDPYRLTDSKGKTILCYKCGLSAMEDRMIISCDYCPLHWHLDCLNPPMSSIATTARKWMCPNHVGRELTHKRRIRNSQVINVSLRRGFVNDGDIEVENDSSEDEGVPEDDSIVKPQLLHFLDGWERNPYEPAFDRRLETVVDDTGPIVFKLPERGIVLDFIDKINSLSPYRRKPAEPLCLTELDRLVCRPYHEREFVRNASYLNQSFTPEAVSRQNMSVLADAALCVEDTTSEEHGSPSSSDATKSVTGATTESTPLSAADDERESLLAIQKLIQLKGKDALMKFLLNE